MERLQITEGLGKGTSKTKPGVWRMMSGGKGKGFLIAIGGRKTLEKEEKA